MFISSCSGVACQFPRTPNSDPVFKLSSEVYWAATHVWESAWYVGIISDFNKPWFKSWSYLLINRLPWQTTNPGCSLVSISVKQG